jgi:glucokinase
MIALVVDLGGSHVNCAVVDDRGVVASRSFPTSKGDGLRPLLPVLCDVLHTLTGNSGIAVSDCAGLAFSFCGLVDAAGGRILSTNAKYDDGPRIDLPAWCRDSFGLPFRIENDARMALLGEWHAGAGRGFDDIVMVTLGTGIGGAAMIGGRLLRGKHFQAGCLGGHLGASYEGRRCTCGAIGCMEAEASGWALPGICAIEQGFENSLLAHEDTITFENLFRHAATGDAVATRVRTRCLSVWAAGTVSLIHAYDPEIVVFGGGVMKSAEAVLPLIQSYVDRHAWTPWGRVEARTALLGDDAALFGALPLLARPGL